MNEKTTQVAPLSGITVLDFSLLVPGPWATNMLADLGASIIHVQPPGGDPLQRMMPGAYQLLARGKQVLELDLKTDGGRRELVSLVENADVIVEGFRPGVAQKLGFGAEDSILRNARLVYCSINGYGSEGPNQNSPGHDINYLAASGLLSFSGQPDGRPFPGAGIPLADLAGSLFATQAILAALLLREKTGRGSCFEVPLAASALKMSETRIAEYDDQMQPSKESFMSRGAYDSFRCSDGSWIAVGCMEDYFWSRLCTGLGATDLLNDKRLTTYANRRKHADHVNGKLAEIFSGADREYWLELLSDWDVPVNGVADFSSVSGDAHMSRWLHEMPLGRRVDLPYTFSEFVNEPGVPG